MAAVIVKRYDSKRIPGQTFDDPDKKKECIENSFEGIHSFILWLTLSIGFAVSYMQRLSPSTWSDALVEEFEIDAAGFGSIAASYWYFYATLQIPIGIILDLFGRWHLLIGGCILTLAGSILFALAPNVLVATIARAMIGAGDAPLFVSILSLCGEKFPDIRSTLFGFTLFLSVTGGFVAQAPNALLTEQIGWRGAALVLAGFEAVFLLAELILCIAECSHKKKQQKNVTPETIQSTKTVMVSPAEDSQNPSKHPDGGPKSRELAKTPEDETSGKGKIFIFCGKLKRVVFIPDNWILFIGAFFINFGMQVYQGLWAVPFLETVYGMTTPAAAGLSSVMLIGWGIMNPVWGIVADKTSSWAHSNRMILGASNTMGVVSSSILFFYPGLLPEILVGFLMFLMGASASISVLMTTTQKANDPKVAGVATSAVNTMVTISGAVGQQGYGYMLKTLDAGRTSTTAASNITLAHNSTVHRTGLRYDPIVYQQSNYIYPAVYLIAVFLLVFGLTWPKKTDGTDTKNESLVAVHPEPEPQKSGGGDR